MKVPRLLKGKMSNLEFKLVRCKITTDKMAVARGDADVMPIGKALMLEALGAVEIMEDMKKLKHGNDYKSYTEKFKFSKRSGTKILWIKNLATKPNHEFARAGQYCGFNVVGINTNDPNMEHLQAEAQAIIVDKDVSNFKTDVGKPFIVFEPDIYADVYAFWRKVESLSK